MFGETSECPRSSNTLSGQPLEGAQVSFFQLEGIQGNSPTEQLIQQTLTDTNGEYEVVTPDVGRRAPLW
jgi:hypothetical protein